jgi:putative pyruvate formate lyase activating enzyme
LLPLSENNLGFVSPTHFTLQMVSIIEELRRRGHNPTIIFNTNAYDLPETLHALESIVDVWLPDLKYSDDKLAVDLSQAPHYSEYALTALKEMVRQVGTSLHTDGRGIARRGIIIRHLVLPGQIENSIGVLKKIAEHLSPNLHLSLMSQYYPPDNLLSQNRKSRIENRKFLRRTVTRHEYQTVIDLFHDLGFTHGWLQDYQSHRSYRPDFSQDHPFKERGQ